jgi:hypothetical protein
MNVQAWQLRMDKIRKKKRIEAKKKLIVNVDKDVNIIETPEPIINYSEKTIVELREIAKDKNVKNIYKLTKSELIEALQEL